MCGQIQTSAYYQIDVAAEDQHKTMFMLSQGNRLSSDLWLRSSDKVISGLHGVYKLVDDLLIWARNYTEMAESTGKLLERCRTRMSM